MDESKPETDPFMGSSNARNRVMVAAMAVIVLCVGGYFWWQSNSHAAEQRAIEALKGLRAIVVLDGNRQHAESINLSTVPPASFDEAIGHLGALRHAKSLDLSRTPFNDGHCVAVARLTGLRSIVMTETKVTDNGLILLLPGLRQLEAVYLVGTQVTPNAAKAISSLPELTILDLSRSSFDDRFAQLATLPKLEWLLLRECNLDDVDLTPLAKAKSLARLGLEGANVNEAIVDQLRQAKAGLIIEVDQE